MTGRLYYRDQSLTEFDATIVAVRSAEGRHGAILSETAFYPTSGGQLHDTGFLGDTPIVEVTETDFGEVVHWSAAPAGQAGERVRGRIDIERRWRHRQQHTAQHVISQMFSRLYDAPTVSVHLGDEYGAIEFDHDAFSEAQLDEAEARANQIVRDDLPVTVELVSSDELSAVPLRRPTHRAGSIRVIRIGGFDWSACGGTHCDGTAQVGIVKITGCDRIRGHTLVKFLSGSQALLDYRLRFAVTAELSRKLTCSVADLPGKVEQLTTGLIEARHQMAEAYRRLLPQLAEEMAMGLSPTSLDCVAGVSNLPDQRLQVQLATILAEKTGRPAMVIDGQRMVVAGGVDGPDLSLLAKEFAQRAGLRGGGSRTLVQFGPAQPDRLEEYRQILRELLSA